MAILIPFRPTPRGPFSFQAILDGVSYLGLIKWNVYGQRWYLFLYDQSNVRALTIPLISSPPSIPAASLDWSNGLVTITSKNPHGYAVGATRSFTLLGFLPIEYNGQRECLITGPSTLTFRLAIFPGMATLMGTIGYDISMTKGIFATPIIYREDSGNLEVG